jgi:glucan-binding YG repeat protein
MTKGQAAAKRGRQVGKQGEKGAKAYLKAQGYHFAFTEISGLAGDDAFVRAPSGKWYSVEVKNTAQWNNKHLKQAREQAETRFTKIQEELKGCNSDIYYVQGMHEYRKSDWIVMWHPRKSGVSANTWCIFYSHGGRTKLRTVDEDSKIDFL